MKRAADENAAATAAKRVCRTSPASSSSSPLKAAAPDAVYLAARTGDLVALRALLSGGAPVGRRTAGRLPFHAAAEADQAAALHALHGRRGAAACGLRARDRARATPLHAAAAAGAVGSIAALAALGAATADDCAARSLGGYTPFHRAVAGGRIEAMRLLRTLSPACLDAEDHRGCTAAHLAVQHDQAEALALLEEWGRPAVVAGCRTVDWLLAAAEADAATLSSVSTLDLSARDAGGATPLERAAEGGRTAAMRALRARGAPCAGVADAAGRTPMHRAAAARGGSTAAAVALLREWGCDGGAYDAAGRTPLHEAAACGHEEVLPALVAAGARLDEGDRCARTALYAAAAGGRAAAVDVLLALGADAWAEDDEGLLPVHAAAAAGQAEALEALLRHGGAAAAAARDGGEHGRAPLHHAACGGHAAAVRVLRRAGADVDARDGAGCTALHVGARAAAAHGSLEVVRALRAWGADAGAVNAAGMGPLLHAVSAASEEVAEAAGSPRRVATVLSPLYKLFGEDEFARAKDEFSNWISDCSVAACCSPSPVRVR